MKGARIVWHFVTQNEITELVKAYKGCLFFALMREDEFFGEGMGECPVVPQMYPKQCKTSTRSIYMAHHIKCLFSVQLAGRNKIRVGIKDTSTAHTWLTQAKYELETLGMTIKNERTGELISDFLDGSELKDLSRALLRARKGSSPCLSCRYSNTIQSALSNTLSCVTKGAETRHRMVEVKGGSPPMSVQ